MIRSSFVKLLVTFPYTVWSHRIHRITQTGTGERSQSPYNVVKCNVTYNLSAYTWYGASFTQKSAQSPSMYVCALVLMKRSTIHTDFLDTRTTYIKVFIHVHAHPLFCIYLLYSEDGYSINFIPNSNHYCPLHLYTIAIYFFFAKSRSKSKRCRGKISPRSDIALFQCSLYSDYLLFTSQLISWG